MSINIDLGNYNISSDVHQYIVRERKINNETKEEYFEVLGYCTSEFHIRNILNFRSLSKEEINTFEQWELFMKKQDEIISELLKEIVKQKEK